MPGQHIAGGEKPTWPGRQHRLHHALRFGDRLWAGCWHGGVRVIDVSDIRKPRTIGEYNYHPPFPEPSHTFMGVPFPIDGRRHRASRSTRKTTRTAPRRWQRRRGRPHGCLWVFDVTDLKNIKPLAIFEVSELDSPWSRAAPGRFGAHQFQEHMKRHAGLLRVVRGRPAHRRHRRSRPRRRKSATSSPSPRRDKPRPQTNDVDVDDRGLVYIVDRYAGFDILEFSGKK